MTQTSTQTTGTLMGVNGCELFYRSWHPTGTAKGVLAIVHGLGNHSGWFDSMANAIAASGYVVYALDLRGHGRSQGQRAYIKRWSEFRGDFDQFYQLITTAQPGLPCFAFGHSLGAIIILDYALHNPEALSGLILMAAALNPVGVPAWRLAIGQIVSRLYPRFSLNTGIPTNVGSRDPEIVAAYLQDPLRHTKGTARLVTEFFQTVQWIQANLEQLQIPVLMLHGSDDYVALPASSRLLFEQMSIIDKEYREYPAAYHDLHNDLDAEQVLRDMANWLDRHVQGEISICKLSYAIR